MCPQLSLFHVGKLWYMYKYHEKVCIEKVVVSNYCYHCLHPDPLVKNRICQTRVFPNICVLIRGSSTKSVYVSIGHIHVS